MTRARDRAWATLALVLLLAGARASAEPVAAPPDSAEIVARTIDDVAEVSVPAVTSDGLEALVPELAAHPYRLAPGPRPFLNRLAVTPGFGWLGSEQLFSFRVAYNPNSWLGYEGSLGHNPGQSVHAVLHTVSAIVRRPLPGRFQPYGSVGYGMMMVFPGRSINADPVTKNALTFGGGLELYIRSDLALRADVTHATVFGRQLNRDGVVAFEYLQQTIGLSFYRAIAP